MLNSNRRRGSLNPTKNQVNLHYLFHTVVLYCECYAYALCMFWLYILRKEGPDQSLIWVHTAFQSPFLTTAHS